MTHYLKFYSKNERPVDFEKNLAYEKQISELLGEDLNVKIESESCFYVVVEGEISLDEFKAENLEKLTWLLSHNVFTSNFQESTNFESGSGCVLEVGPR